MPGEWETHTRTWMAWPCRQNMWRDETRTRQNYADVANAIVQFEPVRMIVPAELITEARQMLSASVELIEIKIDDSWARDTGPNFLINDKGDLAGSCWDFNAWGGNYQPYDQDALMGERILELEGCQVFKSDLIAEGGGVSVDGEGTVITTNSCFLHKNRNPEWTKEDVEQELLRTLGAEKVIWIPGDEAEIETNGHVDGVAAFVKPGVVLLEAGLDKNDAYFETGEINLEALRGQTDARGRELQLKTICTGDYKKIESERDCRSYINSYIANKAVFVPGYNDERDEAAIETYQDLYPEREIVQIPILEIAEGGGGIHCITQQQPLAGN
ncbi:MAG: agmatine deiminase family protein [Gammaproteobacteria bacterium]|nr:agmatine deiminase family protein [Gammaproteobacteria bacterium]